MSKDNMIRKAISSLFLILLLAGSVAAQRKINNLNPAFVLITGDLMNEPNSAAQINEFKTITARI